MVDIAIASRPVRGLLTIGNKARDESVRLHLGPVPFDHQSKIKKDVFRPNCRAGVNRAGCSLAKCRSCMKWVCKAMNRHQSVATAFRPPIDRIGRRVAGPRAAPGRATRRHQPMRQTPATHECNCGSIVGLVPPPTACSSVQCQARCRLDMGASTRAVGLAAMLALQSAKSKGMHTYSVNSATNVRAVPSYHAIHARSRVVTGAAEQASFPPAHEAVRRCWQLSWKRHWIQHLCQGADPRARRGGPSSRRLWAYAALLGLATARLVQLCCDVRTCEHLSASIRHVANSAGSPSHGVEDVRLASAALRMRLALQ